MSFNHSSFVVQRVRTEECLPHRGAVLRPPKVFMLRYAAVHDSQSDVGDRRTQRRARAARLLSRARRATMAITRVRQQR